MPQPVFTVKGSELADLNGKYFVDTAKNNGFMNGKHRYRKDEVASDGSVSTVFHYGGEWRIGSEYLTSAYIVESNTDQPPTSGWTDTVGIDSPVQLVYEMSDVTRYFVV